MHGAMEVFGDEEYCTIEADDMDFVEDEDIFWSQFVVSQSMATCVLNKIAQSNIGTIYLDTQSINEFAYDGHFGSFDTTSLGKHLPLFEDKLGSNKELKIKLSFKDITFDFWHEDIDGFVDFATNYTLEMEVEAPTSQYSGVIFKDEFQLMSTMNAASMPSASTSTFSRTSSTLIRSSASRRHLSTTRCTRPLPNTASSSATSASTLTICAST